MKFKHQLWIMTFFITNSYGYDVRVEVNGSITNQTCQVASADKIKNIDFGDIETKTFKVKGDTSSAQTVSIQLDSCTSGITDLAYKFTGDPDSTDNNLLAIKGNQQSSSSDIAQNLAIQIVNKASGNQINLNQIYTLDGYTTGTASFVFNFDLKYKATNIPVTMGNASSVLYLDFYYE